MECLIELVGFLGLRGEVVGEVLLCDDLEARVRVHGVAPHVLVARFLQLSIICLGVRLLLLLA